MKAPMRRGCLPLLLTLVALTAVVWLGARWKDDLALWASEPSLPWALIMMLGWITAAVLAVTSQPLLRSPQLYALALLLLPIGGVLFLHHSQVLATEDAPSWLGQLGPELKELSPPVIARLASFVTVLIPAAVLLCTFLPATLPLRTLRLVVLGLFLVLVLLSAALVTQGKGTLLALEHPSALVSIAGAVALVAALVGWRSDAGLGGAVAGLVVWTLVAGLAATGDGVSPILEGLYLSEWKVIELDDVSRGRLPVGADRLLLELAPLLLVVVVAREWIVTLSHRTSHDALTQIYNKAYAETIVEQSGTMDLGGSYSVALADIDHFKKVNDTHGHGAGDVVLAEVAHAIRESVGSRGVVCRTGGEEITIFFPNVELERATEVCEELRRRVEKMSMKVTNNERRKVKLSVTVSVGVASNRAPDGAQRHEKVRDVVSAADKAVYDAKHGGRNRVCQG